MGKLLTERELYDRLNSMATRLDQVTAGLEEGRGTACGPGARCLLVKLLSPDRSGLIRVVGVDLVKRTIPYRNFGPSAHAGTK